MISNKSSSYHTFSADYNPGILKKFLWLNLNFFVNNISKLYKKDRNLNLSYFNVTNFKLHETKIRKDFTPARYISDLFWYNLPINDILYNLDKVKVLDIGCGSGIYYNIIKKIFGNKLVSYTGFDKKLRIDDNLKNEENIKFIEDDISNIKKYLNDYNLIISQSFIEHIKFDLKLFDDLKIMEERKTPCLQIHLFPSSSCLYSYLAHGIRHYNPGSISKISKIFDDNKTKKNLIGLGSKNINFLHIKEITLKRIFRQKSLIDKKNFEEYYKKFLKALENDNYLDEKRKINKAAFYALTLQSNFKKTINFS